MSFTSDLLETPPNLPSESQCTAMNGYVYLALGALLLPDTVTGVRRVRELAHGPIAADRPITEHPMSMPRVIRIGVPE